jgi:alkylhydroperoxidase family enzyme
MPEIRDTPRISIIVRAAIMARIKLIDTANASPEQAALLAVIGDQLGMVPDFLKVFANSPAALRAFLGLHGIADGGMLAAPVRMRIATGQAIGTREDPQVAAAVKFARSLLEKKGKIGTLDLVEVRSAGYSDTEIVEIITHVGLNFLTDMLGKASQVEIVFPNASVKLGA